MGSDNYEGYETLENISRRKLIGATVSTLSLGSGCLVTLDGGNEGNRTPTPEHTETQTVNTETTETTSLDEEETTETEQTATNSSFEVENPNNFGWKSQDSLEETTGFCYLEEDYLGALDADEVESAINEEHLSGGDPNNALNDGELIGSLDPLDPVEGLYAVDVDARSGDEVQYYVQLVGKQDGGVYLNRQGAYEISELEWSEIFSEC
jgi:hypothetical protein